MILSTRSTQAMLVLATTLACGAIGLADDLMKVWRRRSGGLAGKWRMLLLAVNQTILLVMAEVEWEHEKYFRSCVLLHSLGRRLPLWPG